MKKIIFDAHQDMLLHEEARRRGEVFQTGFSEIVNSPIKLVTTSVFLEPGKVAGLSVKEQMNIIIGQLVVYREIISASEKLMIIESKNDLDVLMNSDKTGIILNIEGFDCLTEDMFSEIEYLISLGLRSIGLVWGKKNSLATDCKSEGGLTEFGKKVVKFCNERGIIIDLAHANEETFFDVLEVSAKPVIVSHGNSKALCACPRNFSDEQTKAISEKQGVQGIFFSKKYVSEKEKATFQDAIDHIIRIHELAPEAAMLGSDFGGISSGFVEGLKSINDLELLFEKIEQELGTENMENIAYKNYLRFLEKVL